MTNKEQSTALVLSPKLKPPAKKKSSHVSAVKLVEDQTFLEDKDQVRKYLPDILGRVLACIWIDQEFHHSFANDPKNTLEKNGVFFESIGKTQKDCLDLDKEFNIKLNDLNKLNSFWFRNYFKEN